MSGQHENIPEWRTTLLRLAAWRGPGGKLSDEELAANARAEFDRVGSRFYGYQAWETVMNRPDETTYYRVVVAAPDGRSVIKDAPTAAQALGCALAENLRRKEDA